MTSQGPQKWSFYKENQQLCLEFFPREAVKSVSAALLWEAQMLCWLAFGDHEALTSDISRLPKMVLLQGKPTTVLRIFPTGSREISLCGPPLGGPSTCTNLCMTYLCTTYLCMAYLCMTYLCMTYLCMTYLCMTYLCVIYIYIKYIFIFIFISPPPRFARRRDWAFVIYILFLVPCPGL